MATRELRVEIVGDSSSLERSLKNSGKATSSFGSRMSKLAGPLAIAGGAIAGAAIITKGFIDKAQEAEIVNRRMATQLDAVGISYDAHAEKIERVIQKHSMLSGIDDEELGESFTKLVRVTEDVNKALDLNVIAADLARARNMDLGKAAELVGKVYAGKGIQALSRYGIVLDKNATSTEALAAIQQKFAGQAEATATGQEKLGIALENIQEKLGAKLLPTFERFVSWIVENMPLIEAKVSEIAATIEETVGPAVESLGQAFEMARPIVEKLLPVLVALVDFMMTTMFTPFNLIIKLLQGDWMGAWDAAKAPVIALKNLIVEVVGAIGPAILGKLEAIYNSAKTLGGKILSGVKDGVLGLVEWVVGKLGEVVQVPINKAQAMFNAAATFGGKVLSGIKEGVGEVVTWMGGKIGDVIGAVSGKITEMTNAGLEMGRALFNAILRPLRQLGSSLGGVLKGALNMLISTWNNIKITVPAFKISLPFIGDIGWDAFDVNFPDIPFLAKGGIVTSPTLAMIGERGPEAVIPLSGGMGGGVLAPIIIQVDGRVLAEVVAKRQVQFSRASGELYSRTQGVRV